MRVDTKTPRSSGLGANEPIGPQAARRFAAGFTLVELLVVIAIIGILVALLLPAVQAAREAARRTECKNQLKNMTLAMANHESSTGQMPSSGWAGDWSGDPDRGTGRNQPGNWIYSLLPFIEEQAIFDLGSGLTGNDRAEALIERDARTVAFTNCPTRRTEGPYMGYRQGDALSGDGLGGTLNYQQDLAAKSDYAINVGDDTGYDSRCNSISPEDYAVVQNNNFPPRTGDFSGVSYCGVAVEFRQITDGLSKTIAIGEKWIPTTPIDFVNDTSISWKADDWSMYCGFQNDIARSVYYDGTNDTHTPQPDSAEVILVVYRAFDINETPATELFGSAHSGGCQMSMCDGSVTLVSFDVDPEVFRQMGHRADDGDPKQSQ